MEEIWKDIPGFEGRYQASSLGRIRSLTFSKKVLSRWGTYRDVIFKGKILNTNHKNSNGYTNLKLGAGKSYDVHRLVAMTFVPNPLNLSEVNHIDFNKINNIITNLEWVSRGTNLHHNIKNGRHNTVKLTPEQVIEIRSRLQTGENMTTLAKEFNICYQNIKQIKKNKIWKFI